MSQLDFIIYLIEVEYMTNRLIENLQSKIALESLDSYEEGYIDGKIIEKQRLLFVIKDLKNLANEEPVDHINPDVKRLKEYKQIIYGIIDADEREMW